MRYVVFDVETPNSRNDRMSAIGVVVVENGMVAEEWSALVNPETWFSRFNIQLTGITPEMTARAPAFDELWETRLGPLLDGGGLLAAHNAPFDMGVLAKCLRAYCVDWRDQAQYVCTVQLSRRCYPHLPNHRLDTVSAYLGLRLDHHQAGSDSRTCAEILIDCLDRGVDVGRFCRRYDLRAMRTG